MPDKFIKAEPGPKNTVIYFTEDGTQFEYSGGDRTWRNCNPGNIVSGSISRRNGQIGKAGGFAVFPDYEHGHSAMLDSLRTTFENDSLEKMIYKYAPPNENDTKKYLKFLRKKTGFLDNKKIKDFAPAEFEKLWKAIEQMEGQKPGKIKELPKKKKITKVKKNDRGTITTYFVPSLGWLSRTKAISLVRRDKIEAVVAHSRSGKIFLRSRPDKLDENNFSNLG